VIVKLNWAALKDTAGTDYLIRFILGGLVTVATGLIAKKFGPTVGGLFLAFPAIFPATATLIAKQQQDKKARHFMSGIIRGRLAVAVEAKGTALGTVGLAVFLLTAWILLERKPPDVALVAASAAWMAVAVMIWLLFRRTFRS
jgi:uncharacterized membrane protein (GlpM family)